MIIFKDIQESSGIWSITMCEIFSDNIEIFDTHTYLILCINLEDAKLEAFRRFQIDKELNENLKSLNNFVTRTSKIRKEVQQIMSNIEISKSVDLSEIIDISKLCEVHNIVTMLSQNKKDFYENIKLDV